MSLLIPVVCFVVCHGGPAGHFDAFADHLIARGYQVRIYATEPALKTWQNRQIDIVIPFSLGEDAATRIAQQCSDAGVVITDVGHEWNVALQRALGEHAPKAIRCAYYDNPEPYVPGGYSQIAAQVMQVAQKVFFANAELATAPIYQAPGEEAAVPLEKRVGIGYYPVQQAAKIAERRALERESLRKRFFAQYDLPDVGQTVLMYAGGNNDAYFDHAFPAFLSFLREGDLSRFVIVHQQHPGAKAKDVDGKQLAVWKEQQAQNAQVPQFFMSQFSSEDMQVVADAVCYYQTSMAAQFALAGIPTMQVGHSIYEDILVKNHLCETATDAPSFLAALLRLQEPIEGASVKASLQRELGMRSDWADRLGKAIQLSWK